MDRQQFVKFSSMYICFLFDPQITTFYFQKLVKITVFFPFFVIFSNLKAPINKINCNESGFFKIWSSLYLNLLLIALL